MESISFEIESSVKGFYLSTTITRRGRSARDGKTDFVAREMRHCVNTCYELTTCTVTFLAWRIKERDVRSSAII